MKEVLGEDEPSDDIAILTVTVERFAADLPGDEREWRFVSDDARTGATARRDIGALIASWTGRNDVAYASELAFGELVANAVRHAPGPVRVIVSTDGDGAATLVVEDSGEGFTHTERAFDPFAESGRGLELVRAVADGVKIEPIVRGGTARHRHLPCRPARARGRRVTQSRMPSAAMISLRGKRNVGGWTPGVGYGSLRLQWRRNVSSRRRAG